MVIREQDNGGRYDQFVVRIPSLVNQAVHAKKDKARSAQREIINGLVEHPDYDPMLTVFERMQQTLLEESTPKVLNMAANFFATLLSETTNRSRERGNPVKVLNINSSTLAVAEKIVKNDAQLQQSRHLKPLLPKGNYQKVLGYIGDMQEQAKLGRQKIAIYFAPTLSVTEQTRTREEVDRYNKWAVSVNKILEESDDFHYQDGLVGLLKTEPTMQSIQHIRLFEREAAGLSLQDIEKLPYPLTNENMDRITAYVASIMSSPTEDKDTLSTLLAPLLLSPTFFFDTTQGQISHQEAALLVRINSWQERFYHQLVFGTATPQQEEQLRIILNSIPESKRAPALLAIRTWTSLADACDPAFTGFNDRDLWENHPFLVEAGNYFIKTRPEETFAYTDEIGDIYFDEVVLPQLKKRLEQFNLVIEYRKAIGVLPEITVPFSEAHMLLIQEVFLRNAGEEFLERLNEHTEDLKHVAEITWNSIFESHEARDSMHFLPMMKGINIIEFSPDSPARMLGVSQFTIQTSGTPQDWSANVTFQLQRVNMQLLGKLDQSGKLFLKAPVEQEIPGLYRMLNLIAALAFKDLVTQETGRYEVPNKTAKRKQGADSSRTSTHAGSLPRHVQSDAELIRSVYSATGFTPRRVELHKSHLKGAKQYEAAVALYNEAIASNASEDAVVWIRNQLGEARKQAYTISEAKKRTVPNRFRLATIQDPLTRQEQYLETWVIEHTSPKPTLEELNNLSLLYERHYKRTSSLSFLDQLKPWFVGN